MNAPVAAVQLDKLCFSYTSGAPPLIDIPGWRIERGEHVFLQGASGSGKSTLLALLAGLAVPRSGRVTVLGTDIGTLSVRERDRFRARHVGVVFQQFNLIPFLSALDNVLVAAHFGASERPRERARSMLEAVGLAPGLHGKPADALSIGQQQRVAIVRALINGPALLLADEPTSALDAANREAFLELLFAVAQESACAMVFVSHDPALASRFDRTAMLGELNRARGAQTPDDPS
jgi:putative ABC transport system ATP-binding protein